LDLLRVIADYHNCPGDSNVANNIWQRIGSR
jgi:hypothetical protein